MAKSISASVGKGGKNKPQDVKTIQELLNAFAGTAGFSKFKPGAEPNAKLNDAIGKVQLKVCGFKPDFKVEPGKRTLRTLNAGPSKAKAEAKKDEVKQQKIKDTEKQAAKKAAIAIAKAAHQRAVKSAKADPKASSWSDWFGDLVDWTDDLFDEYIGREEKSGKKPEDVAKQIGDKIGKEVSKKIDEVAKKKEKEEAGGGDKKKHTPKEIAELRKTHVSSKVKEKSNTTKIINTLLPYIEGTNIKIVSGFLNDIDQFWKVNHHWDYLRWICKDTLTRDISAEETKAINAIVSKLESNKPNPVTGYRTGGIGQPEDKSSYDTIRARWLVLKGAKVAWKKLCDDKDYYTKGWKPVACYKHPQSPIAKPGTSMHGQGYAIDMTGDYGKIKAISRKAGATLIYTEPGNMHIEFKNGAKPKG